MFQLGSSPRERTIRRGIDLAKEALLCLGTENIQLLPLGDDFSPEGMTAWKEKWNVILEQTLNPKLQPHFHNNKELPVGIVDPGHTFVAAERLRQLHRIIIVAAIREMIKEGAVFKIKDDPIVAPAETWKTALSGLLKRFLPAKNPLTSKQPYATPRPR